jgi:ATP-dependent RNA helicase SUPV3L1/SUV3
VRIPQIAAGGSTPSPATDASAAPAAEPKPREKREHRRPPRRKDGPRRVERPNEQHARPSRERERPIDPNSPFAALLELKARLEAKPKD